MLGEEKRTDIFLTQFGYSAGKCTYFLVTETTIFVLAFLKYGSVCEFEFIPYKLLDSESQSRVWDCWKEAEYAF